MSAYKIGISKETTNGFGMLGEAVIAKVKNLEICCVEYNDFNFKFDLFHPEQGRIQSKIRSPIYGNWNARIGKNHNFDILYMLCTDKQAKNVKRIYIILEKEIHNITTVGITGNPRFGYSKYDKFRLNENDRKIFNDTYQSLLEHLKDKKKFTIEDIIKWLEV